MGLTKPRAAQIFDIDYKQATRVLTATNVNLTGGAPSQVDGVNLSVDDRVLVTGQTNKAQNGIYYVDVLGTGSNGTWVRTTDTDITGELQAGTIVMVTEGLVYADTQWKLTTNNPIVIGTTPLTFEQNSAFAFGNVNANGTAVLATSVGDVLNLTAGNNIAITGNNATKTVNIAVTGISLNSISNGTSNVNVVSSGGNVTTSVGGTSNVVVVSSTGQFVTGTQSVSGNVAGGNITTSGLISAAGNVTGGNIVTSGSVFVTQTVSAVGNVLGGNVNTAGLITATGNVTGGNLLTAGLVSATGTITSVANITGGNLLTGGIISATGNIFGGNATFSGNLTVNGNITYINSNVVTINDLAINLANNAGNISQVNGGGIELGPQGSPYVTFTYNSASNTIVSSVGLSAVSNVVGGNLLTSGSISGTGNITGGNISTAGNVTGAYFLGNVACASGIFTTKIFNGNSEANIGTSGGNANISIGGVSNVAVFTTTGLNVTGTVSSTGNVTAGNLLTGGLISATGNVTGGNILGNGAGLSGINVFSNITVQGGNSVIADSIADTLTLIAGSGIAIVADATSDTITIAASAGSDIFVDGADFGTVTEPVTASDDLGLVTDSVTAQSDLGSLVISGLIYPDQFVLPSYTVTTLPSASVAGAMIYVTNEAGGAVPAFSDGTNWRRVTDRAIVS